MSDEVVRCLLSALDLQLEVVSQLSVEHLDAASKCSEWTNRGVLNHSLGVTHKFAAFARGATDEPHAPPGDLMAGGHVAATRDAAGAAQAWSTAELTRVCRLSFGSFPATVAAGINLFDVLAHTWDIAPPAVSWDDHDAMWEAGLSAAREVIGPARDPRHYGAELSVPDDASPRERFLAFLGRRS